jgi:hypothetical protein
MKETLTQNDSDAFQQRMKEEGYRLVRGSHHARYRGKHRSHCKGAGAKAFERNKWMKSVQGDFFLLREQ